MAYLVVCLDKPDSVELRQSVRAQHLRYMRCHESRILAGGQMVLDESRQPIGTSLLFDTATREEVNAFVAKDPYVVAGLFASVKVYAMDLVRVNRETVDAL